VVASVGAHLTSERRHRSGNRALLARLTESLFLELLRWQLQHATQAMAAVGWRACTTPRSVPR